MVRPILLYAATVWVNGINTKTNLKQLRIVQRLSHLMTTGALPSTALASLDEITDTTPIDIKIREEVTKGVIKLMSLNDINDTQERNQLNTIAC